VVRLSPADARAAAAWLPAGVGVVADPALAEGDCVVETPGGRIEAGVEAQLEELERALAGGARAEP
jgi:flagellar biosynthesis/type III secretory pathway protein FliH